MTRRTSLCLVGSVALLVTASLASALWLHVDDPGPSDPGSDLDVLVVAVIVVTLAANLVVGAVVALARRDNPVGWLFLLLGLVLVLEAPADAYVGHGRGLTGDLPGGAVVTVLTGSTWILWFTVVALILLLTPTGRPPSPRWRVVAWVQTAAGLLAFVLAIPSAKPLDPPYRALRNPTRVDALQPWADRLGTLCVYTIGVGLVAAGVSLASASAGPRATSDGSWSGSHWRWDRFRSTSSSPSSRPTTAPMTSRCWPQAASSR